VTERRAALALVLVLCGTTTAACSGSRSFARDGRLHIVSPTPLASVHFPFTVRWTAPKQRVPAYAVFLDRNPIRPGHGMRDLADDQCKRQPQCPDASYLATKGVFITSSTSARIPSLPASGGVGATAPEPAHSATVVLLDRSHRRIGDAAWTVEFRG
jgi:hypothetical protein